MLKPQEISITDIDGKEREFIITRFPATDGMEIIYKLPTASIPRIGDFEQLKGVRDDIFKFVYVKLENGNTIPLNTKALIDNHVGDAETAIKIVKAILEYNYSFFQKGILSNFFNQLSQKIPSVAQEILAPFLRASSKQNKRR